MNIREGIDLVKMAVVAMCVSIVIGAMVTIFYLTYDPATEVTRNMEKAVVTSSAERLYDLSQQSEAADAIVDADKLVEAHPLVTNVCNVLTEFNEDSLLYVYVTQFNGSSIGHLYTYEEVGITTGATLDKSSNPEDPTYALPDGATYKAFASSVPVSYAVKDLLQYSQYRCHCAVRNVNYNGLKYIAVVVEVLDE